MATQPKRVRQGEVRFKRIRKGEVSEGVRSECANDLHIEADCTLVGSPAMQKVHFDTWLNYQLARLLVRNGERGRWRITARIERLK